MLWLIDLCTNFRNETLQLSTQCLNTCPDLNWFYTGIKMQSFFRFSQLRNSLLALSMQIYSLTTNLCRLKRLAECKRLTTKRLQFSLDPLHLLFLICKVLLFWSIPSLLTLEEDYKQCSLGMLTLYFYLNMMFSFCQISLRKNQGY